VTQNALDDKQDTLVSGTNIKTINGNSVLGSGNLVISGGAAEAAGADTQVQFNDGGTNLGADANLTFNKTTETMEVTKVDATLVNLDDGMTYIQSPRGGQFGFGTSDIDGYLIVKLPLDTSSGDNGYFRIKFIIDVASQDPQRCFQTEVSFTWNLSNVLSSGFQATQIGGENLQVQFGDDGQYIYIILGEADTNWFRSTVKIKDVMVDWNVDDVDIWREGWDIDIDTSLPASFGDIRTVLVPNVRGGLKESQFVSTTLTTNGWHRILAFTTSSNGHGAAKGTVNRLGTGAMDFEFNVGNYGDEVLKMTGLTQLSTNYFQGIRLTRESGVTYLEVKCGSTANAMVWNIFDYTDIVNIVDETDTGTSTVLKSIEFVAEELGEIHAQSIGIQGKVTTETLNISGVPTSATGLSSGDVWSDSGTLKIVS
jgi:hypothetical protein